MGVVYICSESRNSGSGEERMAISSRGRRMWVMSFRGEEVVFEKYITSKLNSLVKGGRRATIHCKTWHLPLYT